MGNSSLLDRRRFPAYFSEDVKINPFIGAGAAGQRVIDEFNQEHPLRRRGV
jgi:hypothetical protein